MKRAECPGCHVSYPSERLFTGANDRPGAGKTYTVICSICERQFDVRLEDGLLRRLWAAFRGG